MGKKNNDEEKYQLEIYSSSNSAINGDDICSLCGFENCVLRFPSCGHLYHMRCIPAWPTFACPKCGIKAEKVYVIPASYDYKSQPRKGKWTLEEEQYASMIISHFLLGAIPCAQGTSVRLLLSKLLNCTPMRLSKKFQKKALGKHTFHLPKDKRIVHSMDHFKVQKNLSFLEQKFLDQLADPSHKNTGNEKDMIRNVQRSFWVSQFLLFSEQIGQCVDGFDFHLQKRARRGAEIHRSPRAFTPNSRVSDSTKSMTPTGTKRARIANDITPIDVDVLVNDPVLYDNSIELCKNNLLAGVLNFCVPSSNYEPALDNDFIRSLDFDLSDDPLAVDLDCNLWTASCVDFELIGL